MPNLLPDNLDTAIIRLFKALYDAAPGYTFLNLGRGYGTEAAFSTAINANFASQTNAQWALNIANNLHLTGTSSSAAQAYLIGNLNAGFTRAAVLSAAMKGLAGLEGDGAWGAAATYFNASTLTSYQYSIDPSHTSVDLAGVLRLADEPNTAPVAVADANSATEGGAAIAGSLSANDSDLEGNALSYSLAATQAPVPGLTLSSNGIYTFDPSNAAYNDIRAGTTRAVVVNITVSDGQLTSPSTLTITVTGTNDAPTALAVVASGNEDTSINVTPSATDPDTGDTLTYTVSAAPLHGTVTFNVGLGRFVYVPVANFNGIDSFAYTVTDGSGATSTAIATVNVAAVNDAPVAVNIAGAGQEDSAGIAVTPISTDIDVGDTATYTVNTQPANGAVSFNGASFIYVPNPNFNGTDTFTYKVTDSAGATSTATATVTVAAVNDAPVANSGTALTLEDTPVSGTVTSTDVDSGDTKAFALVTQAAHGTVSLSAAGAYTYTPNANYNGTDSFSFKVTDSGGLTSVNSVSISITAVNDAPVAAALAATGSEDQSISGQVAATDVDGDTLNYTVTTQPSNGTVTMSAGGAFVYTPAPNYFGPDSFVYTANDGHGGTSSATVSLTIASVPDALTTGVDSFVGSIRDDVWVGNQATLNAGDSITGGPGNDALIIDINGPGGVNYSAFSLNGVELFEVTNDTNPDDGPTTFDMSSSFNVQTLRSTNSTADVRFNYANMNPDTNGNGFDEVNLDVLNLTEGVSVTLDIRNDDAAGLDEVNLHVTDSDDDSLDANQINITAEGTGAVDQNTASGIELVNLSTAGSTGGVRINDLNTPGTTTLNVNATSALSIGDTNNTLGDANGQIENALSGTISLVDARPSVGGVVLSTGANGANVTILGGSGSDRFEASNGNNSIDGNDGNDSIYSGSGNDSITGGTGNDLIRAGEGHNTVDGGTGNDSISAGSGNDIISGGTGNDTINAGNGSNVVTGGTGNDNITVGTGNDQVDAGEGDDFIDFSGGGLDAIQAGAGNDTMNAGDGLSSNYNEFVFPGIGNDWVDGGTGTDTLNVGNGGSDESYAFNSNYLDGVKNVENINLLGEDFSIRSVDGSWFDTDGAATPTVITTTINATTISGRLYFNGNDGGVGGSFFGGDGPGFSIGTFDDGVLSRAIAVFGGTGNDTIITGLGADSIRGGNGNDVINSGDGVDTVAPGFGADNVTLGNGDDLVIYGDLQGQRARLARRQRRHQRRQRQRHHPLRHL